jgi:hypothetical protein
MADTMDVRPAVSRESRPRPVDRVKVTCSQDMRRVTFICRIGIAALVVFQAERPPKSGSRTRIFSNGRIG